MGLPTKEDNLHGYDQSRLSTLPDQFQGKNFLLIHGSLDDNVHYQQAMALARTLELHDIPFQQIVSIPFSHMISCNHKSIYNSILFAFFF